MTSTSKPTAGSARRPAGTQAGSSSATDTMKDAVKTVRSQAADVADNVKSDIKGRADSAKSTVADEVADVANALRAAADKTRDGSPQERTMGQIAESLADASEAIRGKDFSEMVSGVNDFARRNPAIFLGAAALIGFTAARFGKASTQSANASVRPPAASGTPAAPRTARAM